MHCTWAISVGPRRNRTSINESLCVGSIITRGNTRIGPHVHPIMAPVLTVTSPLDPRTAAVMSPADKSSSFFIIIIILSPERFFRNMFPSFFFISFFFVFFSLLVHLCRFCSLQVMAIWRPYLHSLLFLLTNNLKIYFPTAVHAGDIWDSNFELWTTHLFYHQGASISFFFYFLVSFCVLK